MFFEDKGQQDVEFNFSDDESASEDEEQAGSEQASDEEEGEGEESGRSGEEDDNASQSASEDEDDEQNAAQRAGTQIPQASRTSHQHSSLFFLAAFMQRQHAVTACTNMEEVCRKA